jgi:carbon-monoxide dehydrogenase large subunit
MDTHQPAPRRPTQSDEDRRRFVTGQGRYLADTLAEDGPVLHAAFVRSPHAHATIRAIDASAAVSMPGVVRVLTAADCTAAGLRGFPSIMRYRRPDGGGLIVPFRPVLAGDRVRHVGECVACVVATDRHAAQDAAEAVMVDYDPLPVVPDLTAALADGAPLVHDEAPGNLAFIHEAGDAQAVAAAFAGAAHVVACESALPRLAPSPMEPRGALAWFDAAAGRYHLRTQHQGITGLRGDICAVFGIAPEDVFIELPDVGGGFGARSNLHPEQASVMLAARLTGARVAWIGTRTEAFLTDQHGRGTHLRGRLALDGDGRMLALDVVFDGDLGAYATTVGAHIHVHNPLQTLTGAYAIPVAAARFRVAFSNAAPTGPYRGAGRPDIALLVERLADKAAAALGLDPIALRARNALGRAAFPYRTAAGSVYDSGDFAALLAGARAASDWDGFATRRARSEASGFRRGRGVALFTEIAGGGAADRDEARVALAVTADGNVTGTIETVTGGTGQSHAETYASIAAGPLGLDAADFRLRASIPDSRLIGAGSIASRSTISAGSAVLNGAESLRRMLLRPAALRANCAPEDLTIEAGAIRAADGRVIETVAGALAGLGGAIEVVGTQAMGVTFPSGCHVAEVEVDRETGAARLVAYTAVDDAGVVLNHTASEGQLHGGIAQGVGGALGEAIVTDADGQVLTASFMDYAMPRAADLVSFAVSDLPVPSPNNPLGAKGLGEAGTTGALAAVAAAVGDAVGGDVALPVEAGQVWTRLRG